MRRISSGSPWEAKMGYSRAVVSKGMVFISATAAAGADGAIVGVDDVYLQTKTILDKLRDVLAEAGSSFASVVQSKIYITDISRWEEAGRAHGEAFHAGGPTLTMLHVKPFLNPEMLVEIDMIAMQDG